MTHEAHYVSTDFKMCFLFFTRFLFKLIPCHVWVFLSTDCVRNFAVPLDTRFSDIEIRCGDMVICSEIKPYSSERHEWCRITKNLGQGSATLHNKRFSLFNVFFVSLCIFCNLLCFCLVRMLYLLTRLSSPKMVLLISSLVPKLFLALEDKVRPSLHLNISELVYFLKQDFFFCFHLELVWSTK